MDVQILNTLLVFNILLLINKKTNMKKVILNLLLSLVLLCNYSCQSDGSKPSKKEPITKEATEAKKKKKPTRLENELSGGLKVKNNGKWHYSNTIITKLKKDNKIYLKLKNVKEDDFTLHVMVSDQLDKNYSFWKGYNMKGSVNEKNEFVIKLPLSNLKKAKGEIDFNEASKVLFRVKSNGKLINFNYIFRIM